MNLRFEQGENESGPAFEAFVFYRDIGPQRSLITAYRQSSGKDTASTPGRWCGWCSKHQWVQRARAYDQALDAERVRVKLVKVGQLEDRRFLFELQEQQRKEERVSKMEARLDKIDTLPVNEVYSQTIEGTGPGRKIVMTKVKPPTPTQYAALAKQVDATAALAINGVRPQSLPVLITPETPKFDEARLKCLESLTPDELQEYRRWLTRLADGGESNGDRAAPVAEQD